MASDNPEKPISPQERVLLTTYALTGDMKKSMRQAGYSDVLAGENGQKIMRKPHIQRAYQEIITRPLDELNASLIRVVRECSDVAFSDIGDMFDPEGNVLPTHEMSEKARRSVASMKVTRKYLRHKDGSSDLEVTREVKLWSKPQALEMFFKYHDKIQQVMDKEAGLGSGEKKEFTMERLLAEGMKAGILAPDRGTNGHDSIPLEKPEGHGDLEGSSGRENHDRD